MAPSETTPGELSTTPSYKLAFLHTCLAHSILRFGNFTLKSGRQSPYFFQAGAFQTASLLSSLATAYAQAIASNLIETDHPTELDVIFGPAYKGIPLAAITALKLGELMPEKCGNIGYSFNRKEAKDHGEGGVIVGMDLKGKKVLIVDDVITAGTAIRESVTLIRKLGGNVVGVVIALDRMETVVGGEGGSSAIAELKKELGCGVFSILSLEDLVNAGGVVGEEYRRKMIEYREKYGARDV